MEPELLLTSQEYRELKGDGPFTIFVPQADLMTNMSQVRSCHRGRLGREVDTGRGRLRAEVAIGGPITFVMPL